MDVEYDGTGFRGWQIQQNARSVAGELSRAIRQAGAPALRAAWTQSRSRNETISPRTSRAAAIHVAHRVQAQRIGLLQCLRVGNVGGGIGRGARGEARRQGAQQTVHSMISLGGVRRADCPTPRRISSPR